MAPRIARTILLTLALVASLVALPTSRSPAIGATGTTLYVNGKHWSDSNSGCSWAEAYRTINRAARIVPRGTAAAGWTIVVRGYADHV